MERVGRIGASLRWAQVLRKVGEQAKAVAEFERAADLDPENATAQVELAKALTADGRFADAADHSTRAVALGAGDPRSLKAALDAFKAAVMHLESDRYINAVDDAIRTIDGASACTLWADALGGLARPGAQLTHAKKTLEKNPTAWSHAMYAYLLVGAGKSEEGLAEHARAAEREPNLEGVHRLWGLSLARLRRYREALELFQRAAELRGQEHYFDWAIALDSQGLKEAAVEKYGEHMRLKDNDPVQVSYCLNNIACIREAQGNYTAAAYAWDAALQAYESAAANPGRRSRFRLLRLYEQCAHRRPSRLRSCGEAAR